MVFNRHVQAQSLEQMVALIAKLTPDNTHLVGWSLGGLVAQALEQNLSRASTNKIKSLTLVTSTHVFAE